MLVAWSVLKMLFGIAMAVLVARMEYSMMTSMMEQAQSSIAAGRSGPPPPPIPVHAMATVFSTVAAVFGLLWWWALPVFMLIWLARRLVREEIATWRGAAPLRGVT